MYRETSKFKQSVLTFVSPVASISIEDNNIIYKTDNGLKWGYETDWTRSASPDKRTLTWCVHANTVL